MNNRKGKHLNTTKFGVVLGYGFLLLLGIAMIVLTAILLPVALEPLVWKETRAEIFQVNQNGKNPGSTKSGAATWGIRYEVHYSFEVEGKKYFGVDTLQTPAPGPQSLITVYFDQLNPNNSVASRPLRVNIELVGGLLFVMFIGFGIEYMGFSGITERKNRRKKAK